MTRFSANLGFLWANLPLLDRIERAAAAGFKAIELHWPYDTQASDVKAACAKHGLSLLALNTHLGDASKGESGLAALPGREAEFRQHFEHSLQWCLESGARAIHVMPGVVQSNNMDKSIETMIANVQWAADLAAAQQITLLLEAINQRDKPNYLYSRQSEANLIRVASKRDNVKLMFDVYHVAVSEGDVFKKLEQFMPHIGHIQIAAVPSRAEPDEGEIRYEAVLAHIDSLGYQGWIGAEYKPRAGVEAGLSWMRPYTQH
jgi:hydroxypyruvate isomerase